jgi:hypothetical protein
MSSDASHRAGVVAGGVFIRSSERLGPSHALSCCVLRSATMTNTRSLTAEESNPVPVREVAAFVPSDRAGTLTSRVDPEVC